MLTSLLIPILYLKIALRSYKDKTEFIQHQFELCNQSDHIIRNRVGNLFFKSFV